MYRRGLSSDWLWDYAGYGFSVSGSYNQSKLGSSYASVTEQSGILAGSGGYAVNVAGNTDLKGGIVTSSHEAEALGRNLLATGTLTASNIDNHAEYDGTALGMAAIRGRNGKGEQGPHQMAMGAADGAALGRASSRSAGFGSTSDSQLSTTSSGINTENIVITDEVGQALTGKTAAQIKAEVLTPVSSGQVAANSGALVNKFDVDKALKELNIQVQVTQEFRQTSLGIINAFADDKQAALRNLIDQAKTEDEKTELYAEIYRLQYQRRFLEMLVNIVAADPTGSITQGTLQLAATKMREVTLANSRRSPGMVIDDGVVINNVSYRSGAFDGVKLGGVRLDTDTICGPKNERCFRDANYELITNSDGNYVYTGSLEYPTYKSFSSNLEAADDLYGSTGGFQPVAGGWYLPFDIVIPYKPGSFSDRLVEAFSGTHDLLGGQIWGWYGSDGNTSINRSKFDDFASGLTTGIAIPVAAPFALSDFISSDMLQLLLSLGEKP